MAGKINLNEASKDELEELIGVGESAATKIVQYRDEHGGLQSFDQLREISDIDDEMISKIRGQAEL